MKDKAGKIAWIDLTIPNAEEVKDFYKNVVGWEDEPVSMGEYNDFNMLPKNDDEPVTGICHTRGMNEGLPAQWLIYISVDDLDESMAQCIKHGGEVIFGPRNFSKHSRYFVIKDPAGAVAALYEDKSDDQ